MKFDKHGIISKLWDYEDFERGVLWASITAIVIWTIFASPDYDLYVEWLYNIPVPYGVLWVLWNPFWWTKQLYTTIVVGEWAIVTAFEWLLATKRKIIPLKLVKLQIFSTAILLALHSTQNVTVIMFAPLAVINPIFTLLLLFQKIPLGWTLAPWDNGHWYCAFNGSGTVDTLGTNPCLANSLKLAFWTHVYFINYLIIALWTILPIIIWWKARKSKLKIVVLRNHPDRPKGACDGCLKVVGEENLVMAPFVGIVVMVNVQSAW